jgi:hypothetical protein
LKNNYEELAQVLMDYFNAQDLSTNISVGSTDNIKWEEVVAVGNFTCYGVLNFSGSETPKISDALLKNEYISLSLALPNNEKDEFSNALEKAKNGLIGLFETPIEIAGNTYYISDNGMSTTDFRVIEGNQLGIVTQYLLVQSSEDLLSTAGAIITIKDSTNKTHTFAGAYHHTFSYQKSYDGFSVSAVKDAQTFFNSLQKVLIVDYYKMPENELHRLLLDDSQVFSVSVYDGDQYLLQNVSMEVSSYTQDGVVGGFYNCKVSFSKLPN